MMLHSSVHFSIQTGGDFRRTIGVWIINSCCPVYNHPQPCLAEPVWQHEIRFVASLFASSFWIIIEPLMRNCIYSIPNWNIRRVVDNLFWVQTSTQKYPLETHYRSHLYHLGPPAFRSWLEFFELLLKLMSMSRVVAIAINQMWNWLIKILIKWIKYALCLIVITVVGNCIIIIICGRSIGILSQSWTSAWEITLTLTWHG